MNTVLEVRHIRCPPTSFGQEFSEKSKYVTKGEKKTREKIVALKF